MDPRLKGQEVQIRVLSGSQVVQAINSVGSFNDDTKFELKEDGFIGETANRYDEIFNGYGGDFEFQVTDANWYRFKDLIKDRATRKQPSLVFNIIRTDFFANGSTAVVTYMDVKWGGMPQSIGGRAEYVKVKASFGCSEQKVQINNLP